MSNSSCYFPNHKSDFLQILHHFLVSWKITPLYFFRSNITRRDQSKGKSLRLLSPRVKIDQILVTFETTSQFSFKFFYQSWVPSNVTPLYFLSWTTIYCGQKQPIKVQIFEIFECSGQNLLNFPCYFWISQFFFKFSIFLPCHNIFYLR